jgi:hypothetical protein
MKKLYVDTTSDTLILEGIEPTDIAVDSYNTGYSIIRFGDQAAINLNVLVGYQFKEDKENE